ncbi:MAG TPA: HNH endonuclease signature motif containing protein, partial [Anaeromyxobacteraceae bacterium]|nr:HNH endonuclease signature motif containing protein [Anaeromyxobacteraceae bacterium]
HPNLLGGEASIPFERILAGVVRGREAIGLALGEGLCALEDRDLLMDLGYSKMTDYAREELGLPATTARDKAKLARGLRTRPLLREAVLSGTLSTRHALELLPVARGEAERPWVDLAGTSTVRELHRAVKRAQGMERGGGASSAAPPAPVSDEERWTVASLPIPPEYRVVVEEALRLAGETLGRGAPDWQRLEAMAHEFLGWHGEEEAEEEPAGPARPAEGRIPPEELEKALEMESNGWDWLEAVEPVAAPALSEMGARSLDARLKDLVAKRERWDEIFGVLALGFVQKRLATKLGFAGLGQYLRERLGMSRRAFEQRVWLERRMEELPQLRYALGRGEVSYEKARLVDGVADFDSVNGWVRRATGMTCAELARVIAGAEDAQACARGRVEVRLPGWVAGLLSAALRRAAQVFGEGLAPWECLVLVSWHFVQVWEPLLRHRDTLSRRVQERDRGWCTVPGCSRASAQDHHVVLRSRGGSDDLGNQTATCAPHHLRGIHGGRLRVSGTAPDELAWELADGTPFTAGATRTPPGPRSPRR